MPKMASTHPDGESSSLHENALLKSQTAELIRAETSQKEVLKLVDFQLGASNSISRPLFHNSIAPVVVADNSIGISQKPKQSIQLFVWTVWNSS